jgi:hypothetical protein
MLLQMKNSNKIAGQIGEKSEDGAPVGGIVGVLLLPSSILPIVKDKGQLSHVSLSFFFQDSEERLILSDRTVAIYMKE